MDQEPNLRTLKANGGWSLRNHWKGAGVLLCSGCGKNGAKGSASEKHTQLEHFCASCEASPPPLLWNGGGGKNQRCGRIFSRHLCSTNCTSVLADRSPTHKVLPLATRNFSGLVLLFWEGFFPTARTTEKRRKKEIISMACSLNAGLKNGRRYCSPCARVHLVTQAEGPPTDK